MKICHLISSYPLATGGMQTYCYDLCRRLTEYGHDITVFVSGNVHESNTNSIFNIESFKPLFTIGKATFSPSILISLLTNKFDVIHIHLPFHFGFEMSLLVAKLKRIPIIATYHCEATNYRENLTKGILMSGYNLLNKVLLRYVDRIIFTTEDYSKLFDIPRSKISVIPIGVDTKRFKAFSRNISRSHTNLPKSKFIILFVGNLDIHNYYKKGVEFLLKAVPLIRQDLPNVFVNLVGITDSESEKIIKTLCVDIGISDIVRLSGYVSNKDLPQHFTASNVLILPSVSKLEAFGIVLIEAMASGLPIIASNIPGVSSVAKSSKAGFLVEPGSSSDIAKSIIKISKLKNLNKYAIETVNKKYNWDRIMTEVNDIYTNTI